MEGRTLELKVGIFVVIAFVLLFIIVFSIGDFTLIESGYRIKTVFGFVNGIAESAPVRLAGVDVGQVEKINVFYDTEENKTKVMLVAWISRGVKIEKNATPSINTLGILGEKYLEISPGTEDAGFLSDGDMISGEDPISMEALTKKMNELVGSASVVVERLKKGEGTVGKLLVEEKIYNDLEGFVADIKAHPWKLLHKEKEKSAPAEQDKGKSKRNFSR